MKLVKHTVDKTVKNWKKLQKSTFAQNQLFVTFSIFVSEVFFKKLLSIPFLIQDRQVYIQDRQYSFKIEQIKFPV